MELLHTAIALMYICVLLECCIFRRAKDRMALHVPKAPGFASMMKDGARFYSGLEEAVIRSEA